MHLYRASTWISNAICRCLCFTFLIPYERYKLYVCTCTESALGYPMPYLVVFCFTFLIPYGRNKLYVCTCTEPALGYPTPSVVVFVLHFWCNMEEINYYICTCTEPASGYPTPSIVVSSEFMRFRWTMVVRFGSYIAAIVDHHCLNSHYNTIDCPVICEGWYLTQMWKALAWPHYYTKRGDLGP